MAYNYGFPMTYQPMQQYSYQQPQQNYSQMQQPQSGIIWVQGEAGAKAYPVSAGSNVLLMDSESECFYIKSTDMSGMPQPLRVFEYKEVINQPQTSNQYSQAALPDMSQYVKKSEFEQLQKQFKELKEEKDNGEQSF